MSRWRSFLLIGVSGAFATTAGFFAAHVFAAAPAPTQTVTVNVPTGATGPQGPPGPPGPAGTAECLTGYSPGILIINHPGGQTKIYTCIAD